MIIRQYDDRLSHVSHTVLAYHTADKNTTIYKIAKVFGCIQIHRSKNEYEIIYSGRHRGNFNLPHDADLANMICTAASLMNGTIFVPTDVNQDTLF